jgi:hypothetical protein
MLIEILDDFIKLRHPKIGIILQTMVLKGIKKPLLM